MDSRKRVLSPNREGITSRRLWEIVAIIAVSTVLPTILLLGSYHKAVARFEALSELSPAEHTKKVIELVNALIPTQSDEIPEVLTLIDPSKLPNDPFFKDAQKDDEYLIYHVSGRQVLYRPSDNKIINKSGFSTP